MSRRDETRGLWLGALGVVVFAMTLPMTRLAVGADADPQLPPSFVAAGRAALAGVLSLAWLALLGVTSQSIGYLCISVALPRLPAVVTSIILLVQPVLTIGLSVVLLGERPSVPQLVGVALVIGGIAVATVPLARLRDGLRGASDAPVAAAD